jgi:hypothetical protein
MPTPFNPGAARITAISNAAMMQVTTQNPHNFVNDTFIVLNIPNVNGFLPASFIDYPLPASQFHLFMGIIQNVGATTFDLDQESQSLSPFVNTQPAYAIPLTYICYANPSPTFQPSYRLVTAVTNATQASITTSFAHNFSTGTIIRLMIPDATGMGVINQAFGTITVTSPTTFTIPIDTTNAGTFALPTSVQSSNPRVDICALAVPIGEDNSILYAATQNVL